VVTDRERVQLLADGHVERAVPPRDAGEEPVDDGRGVRTHDAGVLSRAWGMQDPGLLDERLRRRG
jgi:hypothetical protein